ncbi:MAG: hypothetical protein E4H00_10435 [Myxococcales bacterium]|nr:MAG: hypothetical protein E4H00_10435 [Myxococcales bacterium]
MQHRTRAGVLVVFAVLLLVCAANGAGQSLDAGEPAGAAAVGPGGRPSLRAAIAPTLLLQLDGILSEPEWTDADSIADLRTIEPQVGAIPVGRTSVKILASATDIFIGLQCHDPNPGGIVSFSKARDSELDDEDHILIVLDTFLDGRSGYVFGVNPSGTRFDGIVSAQGTDVNSNWDAVWDARTAQDDSGWSAEIRIPIKSLGSNPASRAGDSTWSGGSNGCRKPAAGLASARITRSSRPAARGC